MSKQPQGDNFKYNFSYKFDRILEKFHLQMIWFPPVMESPGKSWNFAEILKKSWKNPGIFFVIKQSKRTISK